MKKIEYKYPHVDGNSIAGRRCEVPLKLQEYFITNNFNYFYLINDFISKTNKVFKKKAGIDIVRTFLKYLDKNINDDIELSAEGDFAEEFKKCAKLVCERKKVNFTIKKFKKFGNLCNKIKKDFFNNQFILRNLIKLIIWKRYLRSKIRKIFGKQNKNEADIIFLSNTRFSKKNENNNSLFGPLIRKLNENKIKNKVIRYDPPQNKVETKKFAKEFIWQKESYLGDYYNLTHFQKLRKENKLFKKKWKKIKNEDGFKNIFSYKGYNYYEIIKPRFELIFKAISYISCDTKFITEAVIKKENFKILIIDSENNIYGKGFMLNLKNNKEKKVLSLSHELIYPGCVHSCQQNDLIKDKNSFSWRPLPDIKCVWGEFAKKTLLEDCNYKSELIKITGNPKFDILFNKKYNKEEIIRKYKLYPEKKKILIASNRSYQFVQFISEILAKCEEYEIILKLHPKEDINLIKKDFNDINVKIIEGAADVYELIHISDFIITERSSVGFEAILLGKITFILKREGFIEKGLPYIQYNAAIEIRSSADLMNELEKLKDSSYNTEKQKSIKDFIDYIHFKNDGKASERVLIEIKKTLN